MNCPKCGEPVSPFAAATACVLADLRSTKPIVECTGTNGQGKCLNKIVVEEIVTYRVVGSLDDGDVCR